MYLKNSLFKQPVLLFFAACLSWSCSQDSDLLPAIPEESGNITVEFDNIAGDQNLVLNGVKYYNQAGEDFLVTKFNYFVSNFKFYRTDGTAYTVPQDSCYFLVREDTRDSQFLKFHNIPYGDYDHIEFMVGVDSLRNTMPLEKRTGALDPGGDMAEDGMYWSWNSGYIFMKLEGTSSFGNPVNDKFYYHIGLFGGYDEPTVNNTRIVKIKFGDDVARVTETNTPEVHLFADVLGFFDGPATNLSIAEYNSIMASPVHRLKTQELANNYQQMFTYDHTH